jgi:hypothetical protein
MLHCKIVACKRYLAAASGTLGQRSCAATEARYLPLPAAIFAGIAQIESKSLQDFSGKFPTMQNDIHNSSKLAAALIAGLIAIVVFALLVWLANAFIVLPLIGEDIAGSRYLSAAGMIYFAAAHTVFFVLLALFYAHFTR